MTYTVMLTCVGGELSAHALRTLRSHSRHTLRLVGVDCAAEAQGRHFADAFHRVPPGDAKGYAETVAEIARRENVNLIVPTSDEEAIALSRQRHAIEGPTCRIACNDPEVLDVIASKVRTYERLGEIGIPVPDWAVAHDADQLAEAMRQFLDRHGVAVAKPAVARGGRGVNVVQRAARDAERYQGSRETHMTEATFLDTCLQTYAGEYPVMVMQKLEEPVYDLDMLAWQGEPLRLVPRRRRVSAMPNEGHVVADAPELIELGRTLIRALNLSWLLDCDIMYDAAGKPYVLEVNPRPSGSVTVSVAAGVPLLDDLISLARGETLPPADVPVGRIVIPYKTLAAVG